MLAVRSKLMFINAKNKQTVQASKCLGYLLRNRFVLEALNTLELQSKFELASHELIYIRHGLDSTSTPS